MKKQKRDIIRLILGGCLFAVAFFIPVGCWIELTLFLLPYVVVGYDVIFSAVKNLIRGQVLDENFLMSIASLGAFFTGEYHEAVAVMIFYRIGELFEGYAVGKTRKSVAALMDICPDHAVVLRNGEAITVDPEAVSVGELILVDPGEKIPLDGVIEDGNTSVNNAALTGESIPVDAACGDNVISGSVNLTGAITIRVTKAFCESTVSKILELVENSAEKKAKTENFITRFARLYTPCVVIAALLLAVVPSIVTGNWNVWIHRSLIFLVVSCPCALVISVPMAFFGGIGGASRRGILIKGSNYLEALAKAETVVFDKTGTLTEGRFSVSEICPENISAEALIEYAAKAESRSTHPVAQSLVKAYGKDIDPSSVTSVEEIAGMGVKARIGDSSVSVGNLRLMTSLGLSVSVDSDQGTVVHVAIDGRYAGYILVCDSIKSTSADAIKELKGLGISRTVMLTGDLCPVAERVAVGVGVDAVRCQLLPEDKVTEVEKLLSSSSKGRTLVYVGDGINDAPVLSRSDVGIAMGALGSDAAIEAADIVLMDDDPKKIADALRVSRKTVGIARQNIAFALGVKAIVLLLAVIGLDNMWLAVFADVGVSVIAIVNSMRALGKR